MQAQLFSPASSTIPTLGPAAKAPPAEFIRICHAANGKARTFSSTEPVRVGRDPACDLHLEDPRIHTQHVEIYRVDDLWWVRDLGSSSGTYLDEELIDVAPVVGPAVLQLGEGGPAIWLDPKH